MKTAKRIPTWAIAYIPVGLAIVYMLAGALEYTTIEGDGFATQEAVSSGYLAESSHTLTGILVIVTYGVVAGLMLLRRIVHNIEQQQAKRNDR